MSQQRNDRAAFTLVELLAVMVVLGILAGMVTAALSGVKETARASRTRAIIATIESVLQEEYESYKHRPFPVVMPTVGGLTPSGNILSHEVLPSEAARARLIMTRDLMRMELPDRVSDIRRATNNPATNRKTPAPPTTVHAVADRVIELGDGTLVLARGQTGDKNLRDPFVATWYGSGHWPSKFSAYLRRTDAMNSNGQIQWTAQHEGAECLYLILATSFSGGVSPLESIPNSNIGDTDGDGVPEILDGWGQPLGFVRWPVGFAHEEINSDLPDEFDPFRSDFGFFAPVPHAPYSIRPLIISAGPDGEFGITFSTRKSDFDTEPQALSEAARISEETNYWQQTWPVTEQWMGDEVGGRNTRVPYYFPDPFLRQFVAQGGQYLPGASLQGRRAQAAQADNISSYSLEATE